MTTFLQFHLLTAYGPSNPNRDDQGRPKQALVGGTPRLRHSSQSVKYALRESTFFKLDLSDHLGTRTKRIAAKIEENLTARGRDATSAREAASAVAKIFSQLDAEKKGEVVRTKTLVFVSPDEWKLAHELAEKIVSKETLPTSKELNKLVLRKADGAVDIAMFGRMLAENPEFDREAAVQVAHAITTHRAQAEEDWYAAVDELNKADQTGAGHLAENGFGSGIFYQYVCVNVDLLVKNLGGDKLLAARGLDALARALAQSTPRGKQNSHAHHPRAFYIRAERGEQAPRDLTGAFFAPVAAQPWDEFSIKALETMADKIDRAYGPSVAAVEIVDVLRETGTLEGIAAFASASVE